MILFSLCGGLSSLRLSAALCVCVCLCVSVCAVCVCVKCRRYSTSDEIPWELIKAWVCCWSRATLFISARPQRGLR
jgi:hypothetical protein